MSDELKNLKKKLIYRASYRGTKEMDILLSNFVNKYINQLDIKLLNELEIFLKYEDDEILNFYNHGVVKTNIDKNEISGLFKKYKI
jgi:antitoxin CptB